MRSNRLQALTTGAVLAGALAPFIVLIAFNQAGADDYCFASALKDKSFWAAQIDWYEHWTGRFVSTLLVSAVTAGGIPSVAFATVPLINIAAVFIALALMGHTLLATAATRTEVATAACAITTLFLASMPNVAQGIYWVSGSLTYTLPTALLLVALALSVRAERAATTRARWLLTSLGCSCVFAASGASETLAAVATVGAGLGAWSALRRGISPWPILPYALAAIGAGLLIAAAPGLNERVAGFERPSAAEGLATIFKILYYDVLGWLIFGLLLAVAGWHLLLRWAAERAKEGNAPPHPITVASGLALVILTVIAPAAMIRGAVPDRVLNVAYLALLIGIPYLTFCTLAWLAAARKQAATTVVAAIEGDQHLRRTLNYCSLIVMVLVLANSAGLQTAFADLFKGRAVAYAQSWQARYALLESCDKGECRVSKLAAEPATLVVAELSADTRDWKNRCVADLYGLHTVSVQRH